MDELKKPKRITLHQKQTISGYLFILPWLVGFLAFYVRSLFMTAQFSLSELSMNLDGGGYQLKWVGLENYIYAFTVHGSFKQILTTSVMDMLIDVPLIIFFSLFMALLLNRNYKGRAIIRAIFFLPVILNAEAIVEAIETAATVVGQGISSSSSEMSSSASSGMGMAYYINLFGDLMIPRQLLEYVVGAVDRITSIISSSGVQIVIFIAALQSIPGTLYEVSKIEGATAYETFWKVTFPMVMPHIITNIVYTVVDSFINSAVVDLAYTTAFTEFNYGLSSVFSLVSTVVTCLILILVCGFIQKRTFYYN